MNVIVLVSGGGTNLQALIDKNIPIKLVISSKEGVYAIERANKAGIPAVIIKNNDELLEKMCEINAELIVLAGYLKILPAEIINAYKERIINIHPALLPSFGGKGMYGLNVHKAVLDYGCKISGATVHFVNEGVDTGRIIAQKAIDILPNDTPETLQRRIMEQVEWVILPQAVWHLIGDVEASHSQGNS
ncbi:phosphoribosylglycinamide formyltransferase [Clostridia bacterium]|nr:phosphoribosylglycinamide formyltransferase [Clostridia bacterium]